MPAKKIRDLHEIGNRSRLRGGVARSLLLMIVISYLLGQESGNYVLHYFEVFESVMC